ncbi:unnamed protein product (macronuclear) [Paramecium tetraurelia]|uniref:Uncharacterized protein n=1 Tax=Paramecium tetraurelia TaxID=5888 RepID=A0CU65_PARTE|nr:uncharacterized protein GSPATT00010531001 [Paramecium tetraurelia]CAK74332.1 unnamed protein product [Paramecium tetraurelia]|eukprot:XP_001441729.1 hypothetical protein (macronuclear) [Paramecium tetraurelia strain d4-2]
MNYETPHTQKSLPSCNPLHRQISLTTFFYQIQSPYQQLFLLENRVPVDSQPQQAIQKKIKKNLCIPQPPTLVKNKLPQKVDQQISKNVIGQNQYPMQNYHPIIDLIRQNQDLKNELIEIEKDILNYKSLVEVRKKK